MENGRGAMSHGQLTMDNERAETAVMLNNALSILTPHPPLCFIRFHLVPPASEGEREPGEGGDGHPGTVGNGILPSLRSWRLGVSISRAPGSHSAGRSSNSWAQSSNFFDTFRARFGRDVWRKPRYSAGNEGGAGPCPSVDFDVSLELARG